MTKLKQQPELPVEQNVEIEMPQKNGTGGFLDLITLAIEKGSGIEAIKELQAMHERWEDRKAKQAFASDLVKMKPNLPKVARNKVNGQTKSTYAVLEDINTQIDPVLERFGFATKTKVEKQDAESVTVICELWHMNGHVESTSITLPVDNKGMRGEVNKTTIHGISSTITYAKRVGICALLNISTGDDKDGNLPNTKGASEEAIVEEIKQLIELKWESMTPDEQNRANAIVKNKEVNSYVKLRNTLKSR